MYLGLQVKSGFSCQILIKLVFSQTDFREKMPKCQTTWEPSSVRTDRHEVNLLKPTGYAMHHQFNIQQLYALSTLYLCVLYLSENKQQLVPLTA